MAFRASKRCDAFENRSFLFEFQYVRQLFADGLFLLQGDFHIVQQLFGDGKQFFGELFFFVQYLDGLTGGGFQVLFPSIGHPGIPNIDNLRLAKFDAVLGLSKQNGNGVELVLERIDMFRKGPGRQPVVFDRVFQPFDARAGLEHQLAVRGVLGDIGIDFVLYLISRIFEVFQLRPQAFQFGAIVDQRLLESDLHLLRRDQGAVLSRRKSGELRKDREKEPGPGE